MPFDDPKEAGEQDDGIELEFYLLFALFALGLIASAPAAWQAIRAFL